MKKEALSAVLLLLALTQVFCQDEDQDVPFKQQFMPIVEVSKAELKEYARNPANKPKLDFRPKGSQQQPQSAGVSSLKTSGQIIGGSVAVQKQFPWQAVMIVDGAWLCGGSLITAGWVMTAGHCVKGGRSFAVTMGGVDRTTTEIGEVTQTSTTTVLHENYLQSTTTLANDIALIKMPKDFTLSDFINLIRLPKQSDATKTFAGSNVTASGYGLTSNSGSASIRLNFVGLRVTTNADCASYYGTTIVTSSILCTAKDAKKTICSGDSGGPLVVKEADGKFTQIGVVSFGSSASCTDYPSGYSRVTSFLGWISTKTGISVRR